MNKIELDKVKCKFCYDKKFATVLTNEGMVKVNCMRCNPPFVLKNKPKRIQRKRTKGWKMPKNTVYVGRPGKWGNPYVAGKQHGWEYPVSTEQAVAFYNRSINATGIPEDVLKQIRGKNLACWCPLNKPCHADILLELANR